MHLTATITTAEIVRIVSELVPLRIDLGKRRSVSFGTLQLVELVLALDPTLEHLDLERVPGLLDERIVDAINEGIAAQRSRLTWNLSRLLGWSSPFSARVRSTASELRVDVDLDAWLSHASQPPIVPSISA